MFIAPKPYDLFRSSGAKCQRHHMALRWSAKLKFKSSYKHRAPLEHFWLQALNAPLEHFGYKL